MKTLGIFGVLVALILSGGCEFSSTKVQVRIIEHKQEAGGKYYALLYEVLEPKNLAGRSGIAATRRSDLVANVDGAVYEVYLNFTMTGALLQNRPLDYDTSPPASKDGDFLEMAKRVK
jgi:hypothetical protein